MPGLPAGAVHQSHAAGAACRGTRLVARGLGHAGPRRRPFCKGPWNSWERILRWGWHLRSVLSQELTTEQAVELLLRCPLEASLDTEQGYPAHGLSANAWGLTTCWKPSSKT